MKLRGTVTARLPAVLSAMSVFALAGCSLIPAYQRPAVELPQSYPLLPAAAPQGGDALRDWRSVYTAPQLQTLIAAALEHNSDLRVAVLNIERARAQLNIAAADRLPSLNAAATGLRQQPNTGSGGNSVASVYTAGLSVPAWELDFFGRVGSLNEAARAQLLATQEARKAVQTALIADVANAYLNCLAQHELLNLANTTADTRKESLKLIQLKYDNGAASQLDLAQAQSLREAARANVALQLRLSLQAVNALQLLVGRPLTGDFLGAGLLSGQAPLAVTAPGLPSELLVRRPDVRQAEQALIAANANIGAARAAMFPRITLTASGGVASSQLSRLLSDGVGAWSLAPQAVLPLLDFGRTQGGVDAARAAKEIAVAQYQKAAQAAFREVADGLAAEATFDEQIAGLQAQAEAETQRLKLVDLRYAAGSSGYLDLLDAQRSQFAAQQAVLLARLAQQQNRVGLYKALGGGWSE